MIMKNFHVKFGNKQMQFYSLRFQIWLRNAPNLKTIIKCSMFLFNL